MYSEISSCPCATTLLVDFDRKFLNFISLSIYSVPCCCVWCLLRHGKGKVKEVVATRKKSLPICFQTSRQQTGCYKISFIVTSHSFMICFKSCVQQNTFFHFKASLEIYCYCKSIYIVTIATLALQNPSKITLKHVAGLMEFYTPKKSKRDVYLTFKSMNTSKTGVLSLEEFYKIYETSKLSWKVIRLVQIFFCCHQFESKMDKIFSKW